ncbi:MAG: hypothetical protein WBY94_13520 [Polyangiaceae bacterium]
MSRHSFVRPTAGLALVALVGCGGPVSLTIALTDGGPASAFSNETSFSEGGAALDVPADPSTAGDAGVEDEPPASDSNGLGAYARDAGLGDGNREVAPPDKRPAQDAAVDAPDSSPEAVTATGDGGAEEEGCSGGWTGHASDDTPSPTPVSGYGGVQIKIPTATQIVSLHTVLTVPSKPLPSGTLFLWPGLQPLPGSKNFNPIGNGVLQPVLTWGGTCAPTAPESYANWWISAQYVNTYAKYMGHTGCNGGTGMTVAVGDSLDITMTLQGTTWHQVVVDTQTGEQVFYDIDMLGQAQDWAIFSIEAYSSKPVTDVVFTSTKITLAAPETSACQPSVRGQNDYFATPTTSSDGLQCCVSRIILRAQGVAATTPNGP